MSSTELNPVIFLDRDGVLIENCDAYVRSWEDVEIFPQAVEACKLLNQAGYSIVVVTNQAVVGKGILTLVEAIELNERIINEICSAGANILASYVCHHTNDDGCDCRKPKPGMLLRAANEYNLNIEQSYLVGDALTDLQAAEAASVKGILVRTGRGEKQESVVTQAYGDMCVICDDLYAAATFILASSGVKG